MKCQKCQSNLSAEQLFCPNCGQLNNKQLALVAQKSVIITKQRTWGMTTIAVINIILGILAFGGIAALFFQDSAILYSADKKQIISTIVVCSLFLLYGVSAIMGSVGIFKIVSWGRTLTLVCAGLHMILMSLFFLALLLPESLQTGIETLVASLSLSYQVIVIVLFQKRSWKEIFKK